MQIELLDDLADESNRKIAGWQKIRAEFDLYPRTPELQKFVNAHATTIQRIGLADYHYHNLDQIYKPNGAQPHALANIWASGESVSFVFILYSALDSLAQELNLAYKFGIDEMQVHIHHGPKHLKSPQSNCLRCSLNKTGDSISSFLNQELSNGWFDFLHLLRNRITHRQLLATNLNFTVGQSEITIEISPDPDAPIFNVQPKQGFEINAFCVDNRKKVVDSIDTVYGVLLPKVKQI